MSKKICLITSIYDPYTRGGAESVVKNIVHGFQKTKHEVFVVTLGPWHGLKSLWPKLTRENNVNIYRFYSLNLFSYLNINNYKKQPWLRLIWHGLDMFNLHSYLVVKHILNKEKPNVVMTHIVKGIGYLTCRAVKSCKIKNIHTLHSVSLATPTGLIIKNKENYWQHTFFLTKLFQFFTKKLFNSPDIIISSSNFLLDFYSRKNYFPKSKKIVLTNPVNALGHPQGVTDKNEFNFLFLGQIEEYKGVLLLINVFKKLIKELPSEKIELIIAGTGSILNQAQLAAGDNPHIQILGYVQHHQLDKIFSKTSALIIPSLCYENSPTVIFESLASGIPVLAARIGGIEFIRDGYNGFTFEAGDEQDLLRVMKFVLQNKTQLTAMRTNCLQSVKNIGVENYIKKIEELI